jgi:hypothetical protein
MSVKQQITVEAEVFNNPANGGPKVIRIKMPKPRQKGWQFIGLQGDELVFIRRKWAKSSNGDSLTKSQEK